MKSDNEIARLREVLREISTLNYQVYTFEGKEYASKAAMETIKDYAKESIRIKYRV